MQYNETQLSKLIEDVEKEFNAHLAKAESNELAPLAKSEDGKKPFPPKKEEHKPEAEAKPEGEQPEGEAQHEEHEPEAAAPNHEAAPQGAPQAGHDYDDEDLSHMKQMYQSMSEGELKAHHDCIAGLAKCGQGTMGKSEHWDDENSREENARPHDKGDNMFPDKKDGGIEEYQPKNALGPKSPASKTNGAKINKSEHDRRNGGKQELQAPGNTPGAKAPATKENGAEMQKSENTEMELLKAEISTSNAKFDELKKQYDGVAAFLTKLVEKKVAPAAKAITSLDVIAKSEYKDEEKPLTKNEIDSALLKKSQDASTSKSDRDAINNFYLGDKSLEKISHLLK